MYSLSPHATETKGLALDKYIKHLAPFDPLGWKATLAFFLLVMVFDKTFLWSIPLLNKPYNSETGGSLRKVEYSIEMLVL